MNAWMSPWRLRPAEANVVVHHQFSQPALQSASIKVLNWNIAKNNHLPTWQTDFTAILEQCQPDLIFLQELRLLTSNQCPLGIKDMGWHFVPNVIDSYTQHHFGLLTASRSQHLTHKAIHSDHCEPLVNTPKAILITEYPLTDCVDRLLAINIHGINFVTLRKFQEQIRQLVNHLNHHRGPIILSGDFNTWNADRMKLLTKATLSLRLKAVTFKPTCHKNLKRFGLSDPLDHIYYRGFQQYPESATVLNQASSSDHKPMVVELLLTT